MKLIKILIASSIFLAACKQKKEVSTNSAEIEKVANTMVTEFFNNQKNGDTASLTKLLKHGFDLTDSSTLDLLSKFRYINTASGDYVSYKLLRKKLLNDDLGIYTYLVKYINRFYRFTFVFYNNEHTVKLFRFSFDQTPDIELEEGIKLYVN